MKRARGAATNKMTIRVSAWTIPETGVRAPDLMLVAVRAIAPVAVFLHERDGEVGNALSKQFNVGIMPVTTHAIGDYCGEQTLNGSEHRHCNGRRKQRHD